MSLVLKHVPKRLVHDNVTFDVISARINGTGKTTLALQLAQELSTKGARVTYASADHRVDYLTSILNNIKGTSVQTENIECIDATATTLSQILNDLTVKLKGTFARHVLMLDGLELLVPQGQDGYTQALDNTLTQVMQWSLRNNVRVVAVGTSLLAERALAHTLFNGNVAQIDNDEVSVLP